MHDLRGGLGEAIGHHTREVQVLGRAGSPALSQHPVNGAVARTAIRERLHRPHVLRQLSALVDKLHPRRIRPPGRQRASRIFAALLRMGLRCVT